MTTAGDRIQARRELIGHNIRIARSAMPQATLANLVGVSRTRVSDWEAGRRGVGDDHLERIAYELGRTVGWFYDQHPET